MTTRQATCAERLPDNLASRVEDFRSMVGWRDAWSRSDRRAAEYRYETAERRIQEYPLAVTVSYSVRVELSTGGPADYLVAEVDTDGGVRSIAYHFADWFDHAAVTLSGPDYDAARDYIAATIDLDSISAYVTADR